MTPPFVHYVLRDGQHRPALITTLGKEKGKANLIVFLDRFEDMDWSNSFNQTPQALDVTPAQPFFLKVPAALQDEGDKNPGTWHAIEQAPVVMTEEEKQEKEEKNPSSKIVNDPPGEQQVGPDDAVNTSEDNREEVNPDDQPDEGKDPEPEKKPAVQTKRKR